MTQMNHSTVLTINEPSGVGAARRNARARAEQIGFKTPRASDVEIVVTEAANNLAKHAHGGRILLRTLEHGDCQGLEILSIDRGRGMVDVRKCLADGFSSAGSSGTGLGAIARLADYFDIYSQPGRGTILLAQLWEKRRRSPAPGLEIGAVCVAMNEVEPSGDDWALTQNSSHVRILTVDGLGHGLFAARAAEAAVKVFQKAGEQSLTETIHAMHGPLRATRGASLAVAQLDLRQGLLTYSGVGNIRGLIFSEQACRNLVSHNGTVGHELHRVQEFSYPWSATSTLVMHSDGLLSKWGLGDYPDLQNHHPAIIAGVLFRDHLRGRDDATVVVARQSRPALLKKPRD